MTTRSTWGNFRYTNLDNSTQSLSPGKVLCVGRNYAAHAKELNNPIPTEPVIFIKPNTTLQLLEDAILVPETDCHYETELAVLIGETLTQACEAEVRSAIAAYTLALDLTRRAKQSSLKEKSLPWELAKSFDGACPIGRWISVDQFSDQIEFTMHQNGELKQHGYTKDMLNPIVPLISYMSQTFTLMPGDVILTGTPKGVGQLAVGDSLTFELDGRFEFSVEVLSSGSA